MARYFTGYDNKQSQTLFIEQILCSFQPYPSVRIVSIWPAKNLQTIFGSKLKNIFQILYILQNQIF